MSAAAQATAPASSDWTTEEGQWVLLVRMPHVVSDTVLPPGTDLSVERERPPRPFRLTVPRRVAPDPKDIYNHPYVSSVGDFGRFVLYATHGTQAQPAPPVFVDDFDTGPDARLDHKGFPRALFLCDLNTRSATRLPDPERPIFRPDPGRVGLLATSATNSIILHLEHLLGTNQATLLCYISDHGRWTVQDLYCPPGAPGQREWRGGDGVIKYMDLMLWVDLACGILALDTNGLLLQRRPELRYVPLPDECQSPGNNGLARERCLGVSEGVVRFLEISNYERIRLWTLVDMGTGDWTLDHQLDLENLWDEDGFKAMGLPNDCPAVAFIHPEHATMAYFFQESRLFHVDMSTGKFMDVQYFMMDNPPADYHSSRFVRPWKLPQSLFSGIVNLSNGPIRRAKDNAPPGGYPLEGLTGQTFIG
ncbi:uncharacterized protein LOC125548211 [Triticum urartu]|uniref:DUF1618 domain-containing protein n=1 Tax=Triticum urartu TaxID=4572 RepID=A0A8R7TTX8_TRIUA|nr:uncharacterized protein LOC125548211 [Triticum urartu]